MKTLSRDAIQRMTGRGTSGNGGVGGGGSVDMTGYATESWVDERYLSIEFFSSLFKAYDSAATPNEIVPNGGDTTAITNIKAMFGFWTQQYISALGQGTGGGGGGAMSLADLVDVNISSPANGDALLYNASTGKWYNGAVSAGGGGTVTSITAGTGLSGGTITSSGTIAISSTYQTYIQNGQTAYGWGNHANAGYATQTWVGQQGFLTISALNGYATQQWVNNQGFLTGITSTMINNAFGFTLNGTAGSTFNLDSIESNADDGATAFGWGDHAQAGYMLKTGCNTMSGLFEPQTNGGANLGSSGYRFQNIFGQYGNFSTKLTVGGFEVEYDSTNQALKFNGTIFATGGVSALGTDGSTAASYLPTGGGTMTGALVLNNNIAIQSKDSGGTARSIMFVNSSNQLAIGYGLSYNNSSASTAVYAGGSTSFYCGTYGGSLSARVQSDGFYLPNVNSRSYLGRLYVSGGHLYFSYNGGTAIQIA